MTVKEKTFKHKTFNEQLACVRIDHIKHLRRRIAYKDKVEGTESRAADEPAYDEETTYLHESLEKWIDLDCTDEFFQLKNRLGGLAAVQTLPQVLHRKEQLVQALLDDLDRTTGKRSSFAPLIELTIALAKDLQHDFYPYFQSFFKQLVGQLNVKDAEQIENVFLCFAYLFKILWKDLLRDLPSVFCLYAEQLLTERKRDYIVMFAAQSFSFLIRKADDFEHISSLFLSTVCKQPQLINGVGYLAFEAIKGINGQLNSTSETFLPALFKVYGKPEFVNSQSAKECISYCMQAIASYIQKQHMEQIWSAILPLIDGQIVSQDANKDAQLLNNLEVLSIFVQHKSCVLVVNEETHILKACTSLITSNRAQSLEAQKVLLNIAAALIRHLDTRLTPKSIQAFVGTVFDSDIVSMTSIFYFSKLLFTYRFFERDLLAYLCKYLSARIATTSQFLCFLAELIQIKVPKAGSPAADSYVRPEKYQLNLGIEFSKHLMACCSELVKQQTCMSDDLKQLWLCIVILPHLVPVEQRYVYNALLSVYQKMLPLLEKKDNSFKPSTAIASFVLYETLFAFLITNCTSTSDDVQLDHLINLLRHSPNNYSILKAFDLYLFLIRQQGLRETVLNVSRFEHIYPQLQQNLCSQSSLLRAVTLSICCQFEPTLPPPEDPQLQQEHIFRICFTIERTPLIDFKERLRLINKLDFGIIAKSIPIPASGHCTYELTPLYYLLGAMYINCSPLWPAIQHCISTYAIGIKESKQFWTLFMEHVHATESLIRQVETASYDDAFAQLKIQPESAYVIFDQAMNLHLQHEDRPDYLNHRLMLVETLKLFPNIIEKHNRQLIEWFFDYIEQESDILDINFISNFDNIYEPSRIEPDGDDELNGLDISEDQVDDPEDDDQDDDQDANENEKKKKNANSEHETGVSGAALSSDKALQDVVFAQEEHQTTSQKVHLNDRNARQKRFRTLVAFLNLLSQFNNPNALYNEARLRKLYYDLLKSRYTDVQREAYDCIKTYKFKFLQPYYENIERLIDTNEFKSELVRFNVSTSNPEDLVLQEQHRADLVPIIMRILFGKMLHNFTHSREGLTSVRLKKKVIFRFIAGFREHEIRIFFGIAFCRFEQYLEHDYGTIFYQIEAQTQLQSVIPINQILNSLNNLDYMIDNFASLCPTMLSLFYKLTIILLKYVHNLLSKRQHIRRSTVRQLKQQRSDVYKVMCKFFKQFEDFDYTADDIEAFFLADIYATLPNLPTFSATTINPQLKLFSVWASQPQYFKYLHKAAASTANETLTPISQIMQLYRNKQTSNAVVNTITQMLFNILTLSAEEDENTNRQTITPLIICYIDIIIDRFEIILSRKLNKKKIKIATEQEITILLMIGRYANHESSCYRLIQILIASLQRNLCERNEDADYAVFNVVCSLVGYLTQQFEPIIASLLPFFDLVKAKMSRAKLCDIFQTIAAKDNQFEMLGNVVQKLNAFCRDALDIPDMMLRNEGYSLAKQLLQQQEHQTNLLFLQLLIKNCVFFIKNSEDFSIRTQSLSLLTDIVRTLAFMPDNAMFNMICIDQLLCKEIRYSIKNSNDLIKMDFMQLLSEVVLHGEEKHKYCRQLRLLADSDDAENDFWINIYNIQIHRRTRAIYKLLNQPDLLNQISLDMLMMFILPMTLNNIFDPTYSKNDALKESSINLFGILCQHLNWKNYSLLLRQYIKKLDTDEQHTHKLVIKLICTILNNFSFDLSMADYAYVLKSTTSLQQNTRAAEYDELEITNVNCTNLARGHDDPNDILTTITTTLLPKLHQSLQKTNGNKIMYEDDRQIYAEDIEILKMPIAIAMVKLLKVIPAESKLLDANIRGIVLRVANFLKSRAISIRDASRKTLLAIAQIVGPYYLNYILVELRSLLTRGYMFHVLTFTVCAILESLTDQLRPGDLDPSLELLMQICQDELFSDLAEEKEIDKITSKVAEAKKIKSYDIFKLIGQYSCAHNLVQIYQPLKQQLVDARSHKVLSKLDMCFQRICLGLIENRFISLQHLLLFKYGSMQNTIPELRMSQPKVKKSRMDRQDSLLIEPIKKIKIVRSDVRANLHVLLLHNLQVLYLMLKRSKASRKDTNYVEQVALLQPFVPILIKQLTENDPKIIAMSLRCLRNIVQKYREAIKADLDLLKIKNNVFILLNKYGSFIQGENFDMKVLCFKMITTLLFSEKRLEVSNDQLRILLFYCDQDLKDSTKQAQAFSLLNAILDRQLDCEELREMMQKLRELLVQSHIAHIRQRCRVSWFKYLLNYPMGQQLNSGLLFFTRQLEYTQHTGRESVLRFFTMLIRFCPNVVLHKLSKLSLLPLASRIVNDDEPLCRRLAAKCLFGLLNKLPVDKRDSIFKGIFLPWFTDEKPIIRQLGASVLGITCDVEKKHFVLNRHSSYLKHLANHLNPDQYVVEVVNEEQDEAKLRECDHLVYTLLTFLKKQIKHCPEMIRDRQFSGQLSHIWNYCLQSYLNHSHIWIRVTSMQLFDKLFISYSIDEILQAIKHPAEYGNCDDFLLSDPVQAIWKYSRNIFINLSQIYELEAHKELITKGLTNLLNLFSGLELQLNAVEPDSEMNEDQLKLLPKLTFSMLVKLLVKEIMEEVRNNPGLTARRRLIYTWLRDVLKHKLSHQQVNDVLDILLPAVIRDATDQHMKELSRLEQANSFITVAQRVLNAFKKRIGEDAFYQAYAASLAGLNRKRTNRKMKKTMNVFLNPMLAMRQRTRKRQQARELKKRKAESSIGGGSRQKRRRY